MSCMTDSPILLASRSRERLTRRSVRRRGVRKSCTLRAFRCTAKSQCTRAFVFVAGLLMGAQGGIGTFYNLLPSHFVRIHSLACSGDWAAARWKSTWAMVRPL